MRLYQTTIFTGPTGCGKSHLALSLIEKKCNKHSDYIIVICPVLRLNKTYHAKSWIKHDGNVWLVETKNSLYQWAGKLSQLLASSESQVGIVTIIYGLLHSVLVSYQKI